MNKMNIFVVIGCLFVSGRISSSSDRHAIAQQLAKLVLQVVKHQAEMRALIGY